MRYNFSVKMDTRVITSICKGKGFSSKVVLEQLFNDKELIKDICEDMISDKDKYWKALNYYRENKIDSYRTIFIESECSPVETLKYYGLELGLFISYIITNNILNNFCDELPNELKIKKYR